MVLSSPHLFPSFGVHGGNVIVFGSCHKDLGMGRFLVHPLHSQAGPKLSLAPINSNISHFMLTVLRQRICYIFKEWRSLQRVKIS